MSTKLSLIIIFITIFILGFVSVHRARIFEKDFSEIKIPEFEMPEIQLPLPGEPFKFPGMEETKPPFDPSDMEKLIPDIPGKKIEEKFISPSGRLKIKHLENWVETKMPIETAVQEIKIENLLFAQKFKRPFASATLVVQKIDFKQEITLEKVIEKIKEEAKTRGVEEIEVIELKKINQEARLKTIQRRKGSPVAHLEKKIFLLENNKIYLITIFTFEEYWQKFETEIEKVLNSAQLL